MKRSRIVNNACVFIILPAQTSRWTPRYTNSRPDSLQKYSGNYNWDAASGTLTNIAMLLVKEREVQASGYSILLDFNKQVISDLNEKIVIKKE